MTSTTTYQEIIPTRLYIKQHSITKKKYFGKTSTQDPIKYLGSGTYWQKHIKKHGKQFVETLWVSDLYYDTSIVEPALQFSYENNIVESDDWANLMVENGLDGASSRTSESLTKGRSTCIERYGVENWTQSDVGREHSRNSAKQQILNGRHISTNGGSGIAKRTNSRLLSLGIHHLQGKQGSIQASKETAKRLSEGTHNFLSQAHKDNVISSNIISSSRPEYLELKGMYVDLGLKQPKFLHMKSLEDIALLRLSIVGEYFPHIKKI